MQCSWRSWDGTARRRNTTASWTGPHRKALELNPRYAEACASPGYFTISFTEHTVSHNNYASFLEEKLERYGEAEEHYGLTDRAAQEGAGDQPSLC